MFASNRANFLTDRIEGSAKTINIKKPKDLVQIPKMLDNFCFFTKSLLNQKKSRKNDQKTNQQREVWGPLGASLGGTQGSPLGAPRRGGRPKPRGSNSLCPWFFNGFLRFRLIVPFINSSEFSKSLQKSSEQIDFTRLQICDFVKRVHFTRTGRTEHINEQLVRHLPYQSKRLGREVAARLLVDFWTTWRR